MHFQESTGKGKVVLVVPVSWGGVTVAGSGMAGWLHSFSADVLRQGESSA